MKCKVIKQIWFEDKLRKVGDIIEPTDEKYKKYLEGRGVVEPLAEKPAPAKPKKENS